MTDDLRAKFEEHILSRNGGRTGVGSDWPVWRVRVGGVDYVYTQSEWEAFQAAASLYAKDAERLREALDWIVGMSDDEAIRNMARAALQGEPK